MDEARTPTPFLALLVGLVWLAGCSSTPSEGDDPLGTATASIEDELARCQAAFQSRRGRAQCERRVRRAARDEEVVAEEEQEVAEQEQDVVAAEDADEEEAQEAAAGGDGFCCSDGDCLCHEEVVSEDTATRPGPFDVNSFALRNPSGFGGGTVFFPTDAEPPFSAFAMCPGFTARQSSIREWGTFYASHGIVLLTIDTNTPNDPVVERDDQLLAALDALREENVRVGGPLEGALDLDRLGVAGWSMGGGGSWLAGQAAPELSSVISLAGHHNTAGGARAVASNLTVPTLMLAGSNDPRFLGGGNQSQAVFEVISNETPKMLYEVEGEGHFVWGTPRTNQGAVGRYALSWQKVFMDGDERYLPFLLEEGPNASDFRSNL